MHAGVRALAGAMPRALRARRDVGDFKSTAADAGGQAGGQGAAALCVYEGAAALAATCSTVGSFIGGQVAGQVAVGITKFAQWIGLVGTPDDTGCANDDQACRTALIETIYRTAFDGVRMTALDPQSVGNVERSGGADANLAAASYWYANAYFDALGRRAGDEEKASINGNFGDLVHGIQQDAKKRTAHLSNVELVRSVLQARLDSTRLLYFAQHSEAEWAVSPEKAQAEKDLAVGVAAAQAKGSDGASSFPWKTVLVVGAIGAAGVWGYRYRHRAGIAHAMHHHS